jgi:pilus assembly protein CpaF
VFVQYSGGYRSRVGPVAVSDEELTDLIRAIAARGGIEERRFDRSSPRVSMPLAAFLAALVKARKNLLISGGAAVGKTTMLRALASAIPAVPDGCGMRANYEGLLTISICSVTSHSPDVFAFLVGSARLACRGEHPLWESTRKGVHVGADRAFTSPR